MRPVFSGVVAPGLYSTGLIVVARGFSCSVACVSFLDRGSNPGLLHWLVISLPLSHQGSPIYSSDHKTSPGLQKLAESSVLELELGEPEPPLCFGELRSWEQLS